jgi:2-polyprenyl-6-methoxyphenol hydroxylase-like FAD-dependent oxidoreductase
VESGWQFHGHPVAKPGFTPTGPDSMYMFCNVPTPDPWRPDHRELPALLRDFLSDFGGMVAEAREHVSDPEQVNFRPLETILLPPPWHRDRVVVLGDAAHATTPQLAAGAAICLEDAVVLGDELARGGDLDEILGRFTDRRHPRCRYVVDASVKLSYWQTHPEATDARPAEFTAAATQGLAEPY